MSEKQALPLPNFRDGRDELVTIVKRNHDQVILLPRPTESPNDPLNWPMRRKVTIMLSLNLAVFSGFCGPLAGQLNLYQQAKLYHKTTVEITYANSAVSAGFLAGGILFGPLAYRFGRGSVILWCLLGLLAAQIWAPLMTGPHQYVPYVMSRLLAGLFGTVPTILAPKYVVDLFFLHQRGRAFTYFALAVNFGSVAGPTFSGFIAADSYWPLEYWWTVGLVTLSAILVFLFLEETTYDRLPGARNPIHPSGFVANRVATFLPGSELVPGATWSSTFRLGAKPFMIALAPVSLVVGIFEAITFGWYVALNALTPVWLQKPVKAGGYGFDVTANACFSLVHWIGIIIALVYGQLISDRIALWLASRNGGRWKPEYRLYTLWIPCFLLQPLGLGLFGAALQHKLHWIALAFGYLFVTLGSLISIPVSVNFMCECFTKYPAEATVTTNAMRLALGLSVNFYIDQWSAAVTVGWVYGMMAFFSLFAFLALATLMWKGDTIRRWTLFGVGCDEAGERIVQSKQHTAV